VISGMSQQRQFQDSAGRQAEAINYPKKIFTGHETIYQAFDTVLLVELDC
jgi:hypothetical protein